jgi:hypothetical protein
MSAVFIAIGIWSHLVLLVAGTVVAHDNDKLTPVGDLLSSAALFGAIFFWTSIIQWWLT